MIKIKSLNSGSCSHVIQYEFDQYLKNEIPKTHTNLYRPKV